MNITLDATVLHQAFDDHHANANALVYALVYCLHLHLNLDQEGHIAAEYRRVRSTERYQKWLTAMYERDGVRFTSGHLVHAVKDQLLALGFHQESDHVYVATALRTDKTLVSEDGDYGIGPSSRAAENFAVASYLRELGIDLRDSSGALEWLA